MRKFVIVLFLIVSLQQATAQDPEMESMTYTVKMGETVRMISKKFKVAPSEIYRLNKFAIEGVRDGMALQLLVPRKESPTTGTIVDSREKTNDFNSGNTEIESEAIQEISHTVAHEETLYSLSKRYNVSVEAITKWNEKILQKGLKVGQVLTIKNE